MNVSHISEDRFWAKATVENAQECWIWNASMNERGYGVFSVSRNGKVRNLKAHRVAYELTHGPIPDGLLVDHRCHNPSCVNPDHLRVATTKQNQENLSYASTSNTSGVRGVSWASRNRKWPAKVTHHGRQVYVGLFDSVPEAEAAVVAKRNELFTHNDLDRLAAV